MKELLDITEYFLVYAFLGWCCEVAYAAYKQGKFVNRGFCNGPVCPIYGFGVIIVVCSLTPVKSNLFILFLDSVLLTSALELFTGYVMEKLLHHRWWDYTNVRFNIGGYVCLRFSLIWGIACVFVVDFIHPIIAKLLSIIPNIIAIPLAFALSLILILDAVYTVVGVNKLNKNLAKIEEIAQKIHELSDKIGENVADGTINFVEKAEPTIKEYAEKSEVIKEKSSAIIDEAKEKSAAVLDDARIVYAEKNEELKIKYKKMSEEFQIKKNALYEKSAKSNKRLLKAFPNLNSIDHNKAMDELKTRIIRLKSAKK